VNCKRERVYTKTQEKTLGLYGTEVSRKKKNEGFIERKILNCPGSKGGKSLKKGSREAVKNTARSYLPQENESKTGSFAKKGGG